MPTFVYKVIDKDGRERQATQDAVAEEEVVNRLQNEGLLVVSIVRQDESSVKISTKVHTHGRITIDDMIVFARQLATLLDAGVTLLRSFDVVSKQIESRSLLKIAKEVKQDIAGGSTFRDALAKHPKVFSDFWVHMVETGEASGALPAALGQLADYLESAAAMRRKVVSALMYPILLSGMSVLAVIVFSVWIIPIFSQVFATFNVELPFITVLVMKMSMVTRKYFLLIIIVSIVAIYLLRKYIETERGRWQFDQFKLKVPVLSTLFQRIAVQRFAGGLGTLIESGVPILYALDIIGKATENKVIEQATAEVRESVRQGKGMTKPMDKSGVFPPMVVQMCAVGEEIGELAKMLKRVSVFYQERIATTLNRMTALVEPLILIFMGAVVGIMVVSMFLPIFQLAMLARGA